MSEIDLLYPEAVLELAEFKAVKYITPFDEEPKPVPSLAQPLPQAGKNRYFENLAGQLYANEDFDWSGHDELAYQRLNHKHKSALAAVRNFHLGRSARQAAFSIAAMGADDFDQFKDYFESLTSVDYHLPYSPTKKHKINRKILSELYPELFSTLEMEAGAVAVGAYFSFRKPEHTKAAANIVAHRLGRVRNQKNHQKQSLVDIKLKRANHLTSQIINDKGLAFEQYGSYALILAGRLSAIEGQNK